MALLNQSRSLSPTRAPPSIPVRRSHLPSLPPSREKLMRKSLPILNDAGVVSAVSGDGRRHFVIPADVRGRFTRLRRWVFVLLIGIYVTLPWVPVSGHPAVSLD